MHVEFIVDVAAAGAGVIEDDLLETHARIFVFDPFGNRIELMEPRKA